MEVDSDNDSCGSSIITDDRSRSNALTVKIPVSKSELRGSKPVKLKRKKSYDKVSEHKISKNEETSFYDQGREIQSSTAPNQQLFSGVRQNFTALDAQVMNKEYNFPQEINRKFPEDRRKIHKRNSEYENKDASIEIFDDDDMKHTNDYQKLVSLDEIPAETIQVSFGRDKNRSAVVLSKDESVNLIKNSSLHEVEDAVCNNDQSNVLQSMSANSLHDRVQNDHERQLSKDDSLRGKEFNLRKQRQSKSPQRRSPRRLSPRQRHSRSPRSRHVQENYRSAWQQSRTMRREAGRFNNSTRYGRGQFQQNRFQHVQRRFSPPRTRWVPDRRHDRGRNTQGSRFCASHRRSNSVERARLAERKRMDEEKLREKESNNAQRKKMEEELREIESKIETKKKSKLKRQETKIDSLDVNVAIHSDNIPGSIDKKEDNLNAENICSINQESNLCVDNKLSLQDSSLGVYGISNNATVHNEDMNFNEQLTEKLGRGTHVSSEKREKPMHVTTEKYHEMPHAKIEANHYEQVLSANESREIKNQVSTSDDSDTKSDGNNSRKSEVNESEKSEDELTDKSDSSDDSSSSTEESDSPKKKKKRSKKKKSKKHYSSSSDSDSSELDSDSSSDESIKKKKKKKRKNKKKSVKKIKGIKRKAKKERKGIINEEELNTWFEQQKSKLCDELREQIKKELIAQNVKKSEILINDSIAKDAEILDNLDEEKHIAVGSVSGIPLAKDEKAVALHDDEIVTPPCEEEVFNVFKSDDDLELGSEEDNWKRHGARDNDESRKRFQSDGINFKEKHRSSKSHQKLHDNCKNKMYSTNENRVEIIAQYQGNKIEKETNLEKVVDSHSSRRKDGEDRKNRFDQSSKESQDTNKNTQLPQKESGFEKKNSTSPKEIDNKKKAVSRENRSENSERVSQRESVYEKPRGSHFDKELKSTSRSKTFHSSENAQYGESRQSNDKSDSFFSKSFSQVDDITVNSDVTMASKVRTSGFPGFLPFTQESRKNSFKSGLEETAESSGHWEAPFSTPAQKVIASPMSDGSRRKSYEKTTEKQSLVEMSEDHGISRLRQIEDKAKLKATIGKYGSNTEKRDLHQKNRDDFQRADAHHEKLDSRRQRPDEKQHERDSKLREGGNQLRNIEMDRYRNDNQEMIHRDSNKERNFESIRSTKNNYRPTYNRNAYDSSKLKSTYDRSFSENLNYNKSSRSNVYMEKNNEIHGRSNAYAEDIHDNRKRLNDFHGGINDNLDSKLKKRENALSSISNSGDSGDYSTNNLSLNYTKPQKHYRGKRK